MCKPRYAPGTTIYRPGTALSNCRYTSQLNGSGIGTIKISRVDAGIGQVIHHHLSGHYPLTSTRNKTGANGVGTWGEFVRKYYGTTCTRNFHRGSVQQPIPVQTINGAIL